MHTIIGIFDNPRDGQRAVAMLRDSRYALDDISVISKSSEGEISASSGEDVSASEGATLGAVWGGIVGIASLVIPGVGPFIAGGALATALASAATGAVTGAVLGGVAAALIHFGGIPEDEAREYESLVYAGKTLVAVKARPEDARHVRRILSKADATEVRDEEIAVGGAPQRAIQVAMYDEHGRQVAPEPDDTPTNPMSA
jgi:uncharacterized membrane protein